MVDLKNYIKSKTQVNGIRDLISGLQYECRHT